MYATVSYIIIVYLLLQSLKMELTYLGDSSSSQNWDFAVLPSSDLLKKRNCRPVPKIVPILVLTK